MFKRSEYIFIGIATFCVILFFFVVGNLMISCSREIEEHGLKAVLEEIWEGKEK